MERREKCKYRFEKRMWHRNTLYKTYKKECGERFQTEDEDRIKDKKHIPNFCSNCGGRLVK